MSFAIRISRPYDEVFEWCDALTADKVAIYEHEADAEVSRTHIHILLLNAKVKPDAMKTRFKKLYGEIDKSDWSFKKADDDGFVTYMSKGKLPPKLTKGYDPVDIERLTREWKDPEAQNITVKLENGKFVREVDTVPKKSKISLLEQMRSELAGSIPTEDSRLRAIRKVLMRNNEVIGKFKMMDYYDNLMMYDSKDDWLHAMNVQIKENLQVMLIKSQMMLKHLSVC